MERNLLLTSINSILVIIRFCWVLIIALFVLGIIGVIINPDFAEQVNISDTALIFSSNSDNFTSLTLAESINNYPYLISALLIGSLLKGVIVFLILSELIKVVRSIKSLKTFTNNNIRAFKNIGMYLVIIFALSTLSFSPGEAGATRFSFSIEFYPLLAALFAFLMAEIFKEGNRLREESELTV